MSNHIGPHIAAKSNLLFKYDFGDFVNCFTGEPTTNLVPNPTVNAYPTYGNGWGTYNTNQYCGNNGCATHWTIPSISSVTNNIVTTSSSHQIRTYDVINPNATGGGVTAGTQYFAKKVSDTQFSLHEYNSSQDGSQGYINPVTGKFKVHDSIELDQRISVSASGFPTGWFGNPHQPNSALVKEIIPNGFKNPKTGKTNDCIRLHWFRTDATDGMAYGVDVPVTIGVPVTISYWARAVNDAAVGSYINYQNYNYGGVGGYDYFGMPVTWGAKGVWVRNSYTFVPTHTAIISYWFPSSGGIKVDIANIQFEHKNHRTAFSPGGRSSTDTNNMLNNRIQTKIYFEFTSFDSDDKVKLDGTNDNFRTEKKPEFFTNNWSWEFVGKFYDLIYNYQGMIWAEGQAYGSGPSGTGLQYLLALDENNKLHYRIYNSQTNWDPTWTERLDDYGINVFENMHIVWTFNNGTTRIYVNGIHIHEDFSRGAYSGGVDSPIYFGSRNDGQYASQLGVEVVAFYDTAITGTEVLQNYNQYKTRFNIPS